MNAASAVGEFWKRQGAVSRNTFTLAATSGDSDTLYQLGRLLSRIARILHWGAQKLRGCTFFSKKVYDLLSCRLSFGEPTEYFWEKNSATLLNKAGPTSQQSHFSLKNQLNRRLGAWPPAPGYAPDRGCYHGLRWVIEQEGTIQLFSAAAFPFWRC